MAYARTELRAQATPVRPFAASRLSQGNAVALRSPLWLGYPARDPARGRTGVALPPSSVGGRAIPRLPPDEKCAGAGKNPGRDLPPGGP